MLLTGCNMCCNSLPRPVAALTQRSRRYRDEEITTEVIGQTKTYRACRCLLLDAIPSRKRPRLAYKMRLAYAFRRRNASSQTEWTPSMDERTASAKEPDIILGPSQEIRR